MTEKKRLEPNATCFVCGKRFRDYNGIYATGWCSVTCQFSRFDDVNDCEHGYHPDLRVECDR